jgi:hypothetical protein
LKYEIDTIPVLLGHDNRPASLAVPILRASIEKRIRRIDS